MTESSILAPILPIGLQSIRDGRILQEPCPYALALLPRGFSSHMSPQAMASASTVLPNANATVPEPSQTPPINDTSIDTSVSILNASETVARTATQTATQRVDRKKIIVKLRSVVKRRMNSIRRILAKNAQLFTARKSTEATIQPEAAEKQLATTDEVAPANVETQTTSEAPALASSPINNPDTETSSFTPMDRREFNIYLQEQPSTSSNVYEPPVNLMVVQQQAHELASSVSVPEHSYVSFSFSYYFSFNYSNDMCIVFFFYSYNFMF